MHIKTRRLLRLAILVAASLALAGCTGDNTDREDDLVNDQDEPGAGGAGSDAGRNGGDVGESGSGSGSGSGADDGGLY